MLQSLIKLCAVHSLVYLSRSVIRDSAPSRGYRGLLGVFEGKKLDIYISTLYNSNALS
jgi:hypothetical protein